MSVTYHLVSFIDTKYGAIFKTRFSLNLNPISLSSSNLVLMMKNSAVALVSRSSRCLGRQYMYDTAHRRY